jgi:membrane protein YdbS with pleckstrin-like domain
MDFLGLWLAEVFIDRSDDVVPRTLLGWTRVGLLAVLIAQIAYLIHACMAWPVPTFLWISIIANIVALVVVRRALRWRYPI